MRRLTLISLVMIAFCGPGCGQRPKLDVKARLSDDRIVFDIPASGINDVHVFEVDDESRMPIWRVSLHGHEYKCIEFGALPKGGLSEARQTFPPEGNAPANIRGKTVLVRIQYQYDSPVPSLGTFEKIVQVP